MKDNGIYCTFHYVPLHSSPFYEKNYRKVDLPITTNLALRLVRIPLWLGIEKDLDYLIENFLRFYKIFSNFRKFVKILENFLKFSKTF